MGSRQGWRVVRDAIDLEQYELPPDTRVCGPRGEALELRDVPRGAEVLVVERTGDWMGVVLGEVRP
jgi:hypothetical protein